MASSPEPTERRGPILPRRLREFYARQASVQAKRRRVSEGDASFRETEAARRESQDRFLERADADLRFREIGRKLGRGE